MQNSQSSNISIKNFYGPTAVIFSVFVTLFFLTGEVTHASYTSFQETFFIQLNFFLNESLNIHPIIWSNITYFGNALVSLLILSFLVLNHTKIWAAIFGAIPLAILFSALGKNIIAMPRPAAVLDHQSFIIIDRALTGYTSLPSGHAIAVFCILSAVILSLRHLANYKMICIVGYSIAFVMVISRVAVGAHWPLDIVVGAMLGYMSALSGIIFVDNYQAWWTWMKKPQYHFIIAIILFVFIFLLLNKERAFTDLNGIVWIASFLGFFTIVKLIKNYLSFNKS